MAFTATSTVQSTEWNNRVLCWNTQFNNWVLWSGVNPHYIRHSFDTQGKNRVFVGDDHGYVYRIDRNNFHDGVQGIQSTGLTGSASAGGSSTLAASGTPFVTTPGDKLKGALIHITDTSVTTATVTHVARILSNASTSLTFSPAASFAVGSGDTYSLGAIDASWVTKWLSYGSSVLVKEQAFIEMILALESEGTLVISDATNWGTTFTENTVTMTAAARQELQKQIRRKFKVIMVKFSNRTPGQWFELVRWIQGLVVQDEAAGQQSESFQ